MANTAILPVRRKAGLSRFPGPLPVRSSGALAAALVLLLLGGAGTALSQDAPGGDAVPLVSLDRLRFEFKCYFNIPEWRGRGEDAFLKKLAEQKAAYRAKQAGEIPALEGLMAQAYWEQKETLEKLGNAEGADEMATLITKLESKDDKVVSGYIDKADAFVIERNAAKAKKLEAAGQLDEARKAFATIVSAKDKAIGQQAVSALVRIVRKQKNYQAVLDSNDLAEIGTMLDLVLADLRKDLSTDFDNFLKGAGGYSVNADLKSVEEEKSKIAGSTQTLQVVTRDVSTALAEVKGPMDDASGATFALVPEGEGKPFPSSGTSAAFRKNPFLWHRGVYTVHAFASKDAKRPFAVLSGFTLKDAPGVIEIPGKVPAGMVWVAALKPGGEALFVDRTEVTIAEVQAAAAGDESLAECVKESRGFNDAVTDQHPAWFFKAEALAAYEKATGKKVPTDAQWLQAAFGGRDSQSFPFPWGRQSPDSTRAFLRPSESPRDFPDAVGGRPAGAAPCGAEDMAGNLSEWVRRGGQFWLLGGNYSMVDGALAVFNAKIPLRDPMPGKAAFDAMDTTQQNDYFKYKFSEVDEGYLVGLRTVVPVPAK